MMPFFSGRCHSAARLEGKTAVVTGCNTGIGKETVLDLYRRGARVIMACRDLSKASLAQKEIEQKCAGAVGLGSVQVTSLDLSSLESVRKCAQQLMEQETNISLLINNAGVMMCPQSKTVDGHELQFGTNHLGHFLLTLLLLPKIINSTPARIVNVSSKAHTYNSVDLDDINTERKPYKPITAYAQSKLANVLFTKELAKRLKDRNITGVNCYSLHPGVIKTELGRHLDDSLFTGARTMFKIFTPFLKSPESGAQTSIYCAVDEKCANETGLYYSDCVAVTPSSHARDPELAEKLWELSVKLLDLQSYDPFKPQQ